MRPQVLYVVHRIPFPPNRGDRIRSYHLLRYLSARADVDLATHADEDVPGEHLAALASLCRRVAVRRLSRGRWLRAAGNVARGRSLSEGLFHAHSLRRTIEAWTSTIRYDAAVLYCSSVAPYLDAFRQRPGRTIVDLVDVDSQKWLDYAASSKAPKRWLYALEGRRLRRLESELAARVDAVALVSEAEARLYRAVCPNDRTWGIANGVDMDYFQPEEAPEEPFSAVFVGALDYRANVQGVQWFLRHVWPTLRDRNPGARFHIVGRRPGGELTALHGGDGIEVHGDVPDVRPFISSAALAIAPLQIARGIQNKVLEAMAMGKATVATPQALEGLEATPDEDLAVPEGPAQWMEWMERLWRQPELRSRLGAAGRRYIEQHHSWGARLATFGNLLEFPTDGAAATTTMRRGR